MENRYPLFVRNRILKKELLLALRDYSFEGLQLQYQDYSDGILQGCIIHVDKEKIWITPGMIKYGAFIFLLDSKQKISYQPTETWVSLKAKLSWDNHSLDERVCCLELKLEENLERKEGEFEFCRFKLKKGSRLRMDYKDFFDIRTEFDTINVIHASWSGIKEETLSPSITKFYAREALKCQLTNPYDISFCYFCLSHTTAIPKEIIEDYLKKRLVLDSTRILSKEEQFNLLERLLIQLRTGRENKEIRGRNHHHSMIIE